ncbi:hypothetical protein KKB40_06125, partial [Patescibacteria group bacterium]|nr:hypothetical protein [Patescibacteria group bacterium]
DGFLKSTPGSSLTDIKVNLKKWHEALKKSVISSKPPATSSKSKGNYRKLKEFKSPQVPINSFKFLYDPVDNLDPSNLTYEIFIELVNKTDWHLRRLVESLEKKLNDEKMFYKVEKARIKDKARGGRK